MTNASQTAICLGFGYCASALAPMLTSRGWRVVGTARGDDKATQITASGYNGAVFGASLPFDGAHILVSTPPIDGTCPAFGAYKDASRAAASITYLSTTGVYGDLGGSWTFEWTPTNPRSARAEARVAAEARWRSLVVPVRVVRLPGIYGPGRAPFDRIRDGEARRIVKPGQVFSRAHVTDIARGLAALIERPDLSGVFHICDDEPAPPQDVTAFAAELIGASPPPEISIDKADLSPMARSFYAECKRVSNARIKAALGWRPLFPTYREGLRAVLEAEG
ncbi:MAG: SDR family NAD(P)-dependent oxidoreductase [Pseudomonadota bacterium]